VPSPAFLLSWWLQVAVVAAVVGLSLALVARRSPLVRLVSWRAVLVVALLLPMAALLPARTPPRALSVMTEAVAVIATAPASMSARQNQVEWTTWLVYLLAAIAAAHLARLLTAWARLRRACRRLPVADSPLFDELRQRLDVEATLVWHHGISQPFTFGHRPAIVVLPAELATATAAELRGILAHELTHVARRDWRWLVVEECVGALLWFHPAVRVALREVCQAREELVDRATVALTGARRTYLETLVALAGRPAPSHAMSLSIFGSRQLPRRIAALASEASMSRIGVVLASTIVIVAGAVSVTAAVRTFPLAPAAQTGANEAGPIEKQAYMAPRDAPPPARVHYVAPTLPPDALSAGEFEVELRLVIDAGGTVAEARNIKSGAASPAAVAAVVSAARHWRFAAPEMAPLALTTTLTFRPATDQASGTYSSIERPIPIEIKKAAYPEDAMQAKVEGDVQVAITIGSDGRVTDARVVKSPTPSMADAALTAIKASTFHPGRKDGEPVPVQVTMSIRFKLQ